MIGTGVAKQVRYKAQPTWATLPGTGSAQVLRRVTSDLNKKKGTFESAEITQTLQRRDFRHGASSVEGSINGELSPGTWKDFLGAALRRDATTVAAISGASITVAGSGPTYTVTRAAGSFLTDGVKAGSVVRLTAGSFNAANLNKNLAVLSLTATVLTVMPLNGVALVAEGPIAAATVSSPGKVNYVPSTGHLDKMFTIEHWFSDLAQSELFDSCKVDEVAVTIAPNGMATLSTKFLGREMLPATAQYFVAPTAETSSGLLAGPQGILVAQGAAIATLTGLNFSIKGGMKGEQVIGSTTFADITEGRVLVDGQMTALFDSATLRDLFLNETEASVVAILGTSPAAAAEFMAFSLPRVKLGGADKDDGDKSIVQTLPFTALEYTAGGAAVASEATTLWMQDSLG